ncbi:2-dehydropantoate 2-reductase (Ketopantoate reductase) (KPA reductase) (KPR) [Coniosporium tulheliwenetii]|uniref:2-dehydropantoate 2-reductase (Ketopantoate reductase) (KPA reductase) (KPR) n=1 Tax=Coniosporium tulheliwenetii TaxID=3383036 RepID=A0ACC2Z0Y3_9PEZI|nr:2-dehydropantoate 2-reductase (Ketopantoate reductase) (KPA reductase) (KPR) [Cladosporium sp. JES 115]
MNPNLVNSEPEYSTQKERKPYQSRRSLDSYRPPDVPRRIHMLGMGSIGKLVAHSLRGLPNPPPVTLLFHRTSMLEQWNDGPRELRLTTQGVTEARTGYDVETAIPRRREHGRELGLDNSESRPTSADPYVTETASPEDASKYSDPIHNLILTVKATQTVSALLAVKHRLSASSSILFLQNGMGILEEVNRDVFPNPETRPNYMLGIISHGHRHHATRLLPDSHLRNLHYSLPDLPLRGGLGHRWDAQSRYLLRTLTRTPVLAAVGFAPTELLQLQLEKLAINAIINPLTVLLDARNGALLYNYSLSRAMRMLLSEISHIILSLPELRGLPNITARFSPQRLETLVVGVAGKTRENVSSMLADARKGQQTEIEYINGYIVRRGRRWGVCV